MFRPGALTLGVFFPLESYGGPVARMDVAADEVLQELAEYVLPHFPAHEAHEPAPAVSAT
ncbi:hypothetical protein ABZ920_01100 [Streptomyces sp. NPDC046831]|uniref:hypothetical protein n=1 Tax=Streptomyces sp. NPDC046831 TaxID=3154805 RepID=UPI0033C2FCF1